MRTAPRGVVFWIAIAALGGVVFLAPFLLLFLPNPAPVTVTALSRSGLGTYIGRAPAFVREFPAAAMNGQVPPNQAHVGTDAHVYVKDKALSALDSYTITSISSRQGVAVDRRIIGTNELEIAPRAPLAAGSYLATIPRSDMYGSTDYYYFIVDAE
jgi:hypothetical protein